MSEKPLLLSTRDMSQLSDEELREGIAELRARRESLAENSRKEAEAKRATAKQLPRDRPKPVKQHSAEQVALLKMLKGE